MSVVTVQPATGAKNQDFGHDDQPPNYSELHPSYAAAGQASGQPQPAFGAPGQQQPMGWMPIPTSISFSCPPGLEYLTAVDQLLVMQFLGIFPTTEYKITNALNQVVYFATEASKIYVFNPRTRGFTIHIKDNFGREVMRINKPYKEMGLASCWCCCALSDDNLFEVEVEAPIGQVIGRVRQTRSTFGPHYDITSPNDDVLLKIRGPKCVCDGSYNEQDFNIFTPDMSHSIGKISKKWRGCNREMYTNAPKFEVSYPMDLDVKMKATLFGALFLTNSTFFNSIIG